MRVLFVTDRHPFPPRDGVALPVARLALGLARSHEVDVAVVGGEEGGETPASVGRLHRLGGRQGEGVVGALEELILRRPRFEWRNFEGEALERLVEEGPYDVAWFSPVGCLGVLREARGRGLGLAGATALGLNDAVTSLYVATGRESLQRGRGWDRIPLLRWLRLPWIWHFERRALAAVDLVHVQTAVEARRVEKRVGGRTTAGGPWVLTAQNGRKDELEKVEAPRGGERGGEPRVLLMAHLGPDPAPGAWWFLDRAWPRIRQRLPEARLDLVGRVPEEDRTGLPEGVELRGLVDDLAAVYGSVSAAVVPMFRGTGLVNRALDAMTAGVPLVTTEEVLATVRGALPGEHALTADDPEAFADAVVRILEDPELARDLGRNGRALALEQPTWDETVERVERALEHVVGTGPETAEKVARR